MEKKFNGQKSFLFQKWENVYHKCINIHFFLNSEKPAEWKSVKPGIEPGSLIIYVTHLPGWPKLTTFHSYMLARLKETDKRMSADDF